MSKRRKGKWNNPDICSCSSGSWLSVDWSGSVQHVITFSIAWTTSGLIICLLWRRRQHSECVRMCWCGELVIKMWPLIVGRISELKVCVFVPPVGSFHLKSKVRHDELTLNLVVSSSLGDADLLLKAEEWCLLMVCVTKSLISDQYPLTAK